MKKYKIGQIPSLTVRPGETLAFQVESGPGQPVTYHLGPQSGTDGPMEIVYWNGKFTFTPGPMAKDKVEATIIARFAGKQESQKVDITCLPRLGSEYNIISADGVMPKATSSNYEQTSELADREAVFNNIADPPVKTKTKKVVVSGVKVVFDPREKKSLFKYKDRKDISEMTICADEVIIRGSLKLPGTKLSIYARSLTFEDIGDEIAAINTTPLFPEIASEKDEGLNGGNAGDIYLYVKQLNLAAKPYRFAGMGGNGQAARSGLKGADGASMSEWDGIIEVQNTYNKAVKLDWRDEIKKSVPQGCKPVYAQVLGVYTYIGDITSNKTFYFGNSDKWPEDGKPPGKIPGRPGQGGNGANLYSAFSDRFAPSFFRPGAAGKKAEDIPAAKAGEPQYSCRIGAMFTDDTLPGDPVKSGFNVIETHRSKAPSGAPAPDVNPKYPAGKNGEVRPLDRKDEGYWIHPLAVQAFLLYARDVFLAGKPEAVRPIIDEYLKALEAAERAGKASIEITGLAAELSGLAKKIDGPYDYFGNPAGWVPMLSFEANLTLYEKEIDRAMRMMFLAYWIEKNQSSNEQAATLLGNAMERMKDESKQAVSDYTAATDKLTGLNGQHNKITTDICGLLVDLDTREKQLRAKAMGDLQVEHLIRSSGKLLGGLLQLIPAYQPALGAVGKGLTVLSDLDLKKPLDTLPTLASALWETDLVQKNLKPKAVNYAKTYFELTEDNNDKAVEVPKEDDKKTEEEKEREEEDAEVKKGVAKKKIAEKVKQQLEDEKAAKKSITDALAKFAVPEKEITAELERLKAACPAYTELANKIEALGKEKTAFAEQITAVMNTLEDSSATIVKNALADVEMRSQLSKSLNRLNAEAWQYARTMGQRARDRMVKYYYYLVKSHNYLMVKALPEVDYSAQYMISAFAEMVSPPKNGILSSDQYNAFRVVYENQLTKITDEIIKSLQTGSQRRETFVSVSMTPEQIKTLNDDKSVTINLLKMGFIDLKEEDIRITKIETTQAKVKSLSDHADAIVKLNFKHSGVSTIRRDGELYLFRSGDYSGQKGRDDRTFWGTTISYQAGAPKLDPMTESKSDQSLIYRLLKEKSGVVQYEPSAWADIKIDRSATPMTFEGRLESLSLKIYYAFRPVQDNYFTLLVQTRDGLEPYTECDKPDLNKRSHGVGGFLRTYNANATGTIKLTATERFGGLGFVGWRKNEGKPDPKNPLTVTLKPDDYLTVEPLYAPLPEGEYGSDPWPEGVAGWTTSNWQLWNDSKMPITMDKFGDKANWQKGRPFDSVPGTLMGDDEIKTAFQRNTVGSGERLRFTVSVNPAAKGQTTGAVTYAGILWFSFTTNKVTFDFKGEVIEVSKPTFRLKQPESFEIDRENKIIKFLG